MYIAIRYQVQHSKRTRFWIPQYWYNERKRYFTAPYRVVRVDQPPCQNAKCKSSEDKGVNVMDVSTMMAAGKHPTTGSVFGVHVADQLTYCRRRNCEGEKKRRENDDCTSSSPLSAFPRCFCLPCRRQRNTYVWIGRILKNSTGLASTLPMPTRYLSSENGTPFSPTTMPSIGGSSGCAARILRMLIEPPRVRQLHLWPPGSQCGGSCCEGDLFYVWIFL